MDLRFTTHAKYAAAGMATILSPALWIDAHFQREPSALVLFGVTLVAMSGLLTLETYFE